MKVNIIIIIIILIIPTTVLSGAEGEKE